MFEEKSYEDSSNPNENQSIPEYLYMMRHTYRDELYKDGTNIKCFHRTDQVFALHNHFPMRCLNTTGHHTCTGFDIPPSVSFLMHFRRNRSPPKDCPTPDNPIKCTVHDRNIWRFMPALNITVYRQLNQIFKTN